MKEKTGCPAVAKFYYCAGSETKSYHLFAQLAAFVPHEPKCEYDSLNEVAVELLHLQPGQPIDDQANIQDALEGVFRLTCALKTEDRDPTKGLREFVHQIKTDKRFADLRQV